MVTYLKLNKTRKEKAKQREKHLEAVRKEKDKKNQNQEKAEVEEMDREENQSSGIKKKSSMIRGYGFKIKQRKHNKDQATGSKENNVGNFL